MALATLAGQVRLSALPGPSPVEEPMVTLRPQGGLRMRVARRERPAGVAPAPDGAASSQTAATCPYGHGNA
ncbi:cytochrome P450 [Streptomyces sp. CB03238]|uniref:cytochrome P450 n=1 Tax=Streptomyces sp. CB03238 TaxID=1907777 RepID=UPI001F4D8EC8|nr:cytochrome P450 [Streptomyces sp. CB03238]